MRIRSRPLVLLVVVALVVSAAAPAAAQSQPPWAQGMYNDFSEMVPTYNEQVREGSLNLGLGNGLLESQRATLRVDDGDETAYFWFTTNGNKVITSHGMGQHPDGATLVVRTDRQTLNGIADPQNRNPVADFRQAVKDGRITFSGRTLETIVLGTGVSIAQRLGLL